MKRYHVHGTGYRDNAGEYDVTLTVWGNTDEDAQARAWRLLPELDVEEIEEADDDPTPWCSGCWAMKKADCKCGPLAENE